MKASILSIGNELLEGYVINSNEAYFSSILNERGIKVIRHISVLDNELDIINNILLLKEDSDLIIVSGGLGPTSDDITKESIAKAFNIELSINDKELAILKEYFNKNNIKYYDTNTKQAMFSKLDTIIINHNGSANGYYFDIDNTKICVLPGPPNENREMFNEFINVITKEVVYTKNLYLINIGESIAENTIKDIYSKYSNVYIGTYMQDYGINYRLKSSNKDDIDNCFNELKAIFKDYYLIDSDKPIESIVNYLIDNNLTISFVESCTAGLACSYIASIPGSSAILKESIITYSNEAKNKYVNVDNEIIKKYGAVSKECAIAMVKGLYDLTKANICISITGIAGPDGGSKDKPVGLVHFALIINDKIYHYSNVFRGDRNQIRTRASKYIIFETYKVLRDFNHL